MEKRVDNCTLDETISKYEPMIRRLARGISRNAACTFEDAMQEGRLSLVRSFRNYDASKNMKFSTWAYANIQYSILDYQNNNLYSFGHASMSVKKIISKFGTDFTADDLVAAGYTRGCAEGYVRLIESKSINEIPEDYDVASDDPDPDLSMLEWRDGLSDREQIVIEHTFALNGKRELSSNEIAKLLGKDRKTVNRAYKSAIEKLRKNPAIICWNQ